MSERSVWVLFCNLIFPCLNFITDSFSNSSSEVSDLPLSVLTEILVKLPIKSVITCKCVCKGWKNLILDQDFTNIYSKSYPFTAIAVSQHRIVHERLTDETFYFLEIGSGNDVTRTPFSRKALDFPRTGVLSIVGSCNGLLCLLQRPELKDDSNSSRDSSYNNEAIYIINPLFGKVIKLPRVKHSEYMANVVYGFGLSAKSDNYKVLRIVRRYHFPDGASSPERKVDGEILTVGMDKKWRRLKKSSIPFLLFPCGVFLNGIIHIIADDWTSGFIFAFDVEKEKGHRIPIPTGLHTEPGNLFLALWDGKLCFTDNGSGLQVDIWTMKQYGNVKSWSREIILNIWFPSDLRPYPYIAITTLKNGDLLMACEHQGDPMLPRPDHLVSFNSRTKTCSKIKVYAGEMAVCFFTGYSPSFISL